jgi:hypothetical protein
MMRYALVAIWLGTISAAGFAQAPPAKPKPQAGPLVDSNRLFLQLEAEGPTGTTLVFGNPSQAGTYVSRVHIPPNTKNRPRYYDQDRWVTVLKGTWWVGRGDVFRQDRLTAVREGGLMYQPANLKHYDIAGTEDVILQITGVGPVKPVHAEVDMAGQPVPVGGPYPEDMIDEGGGRRRRPRLAQPPLIQDPNDPDQAPQRQPQQQPQ